MGAVRARIVQRKELAILVLVKPRALEIEQWNSGQVRERERADRQLRERLICRRFGLVVEKMHRAIPDLEKVDVAGNDAFVTRDLPTLGCRMEGRQPFPKPPKFSIKSSNQDVYFI